MMTARLLAAVRSHYPQADLTGIERAFDMAAEAHGDQRRASGEPYVTHPIAAAEILAELGTRPGRRSRPPLLHDVPEDTEYALADIEERFGQEVAHLVDGVTKLGKFSTLSHEQQQAENIRKMFLAMADDIRVVLIKLADRLHNMRTLGALPIEKQLRIARQTLEIYAPLAERLGIWQVKWELEDLAFKVLEPERFRELAQAPRHAAQGSRGLRRAGDRGARAARSSTAGIEADLQGRPKHIYSIWKKMQRKAAEFGEIYDVYAIRILVEDVRDCYAALGIVHALWRPIPGQFDDYIAVPKNNLYQCLHTAVIALDGKPLEIQIRTQAMHQVSRGRDRRPLALQGRLARPTATTTRSSPGCASSWTGSATSATRPSSSRASSSTSSRTRSSCSRPKGDIKDLPGRRDAARLRLPDPHRRRPPDDRREGQQPARARSTTG